MNAKQMTDALLLLSPPTHLLSILPNAESISVQAIQALKDVGDNQQEKKQSADFVQRFMDYVEIVEQDLKPGLGDNSLEP